MLARAGGGDVGARVGAQADHKGSVGQFEQDQKNILSQASIDERYS